jgi:hypothetical protein
MVKTRSQQGQSMVKAKSDESLGTFDQADKTVLVVPKDWRWVTDLFVQRFAFSPFLPSLDNV